MNPALGAAIERLTARLRHHAACFHEGLAVWNRDEETCDCGLMVDLALVVDAARGDARARAIEECMQALCLGCEKGIPALSGVFGGETQWWHSISGSVDAACHAARLRRALFLPPEAPRT